MLPQLENEYSERLLTDCFGGYNRQLKIEEGEMYFTENLSTERYPLLSNRGKRGLVKTLNEPSALLGRSALAYVDGGRLYYDGEATELCGILPGDKSLVSMGAYICVFPDNLYYNCENPEDRGSMEAGYSSVGRVSYSLCRADGTEYPAAEVSDTAPPMPVNGKLWIDSSKERHALYQWSAALGEWSELWDVYTGISFVSTGEIVSLFKAGDGVSISGSVVPWVNGEHTVYAIGGDGQRGDYIVIAGILDNDISQEGSLRIERKVPRMDFVIQCQNRLWGCGGNEIFCCALGDFKNWRQFKGLSTDSWRVSVGSDGEWTGAISYMGCPMFFKENGIYRITVSAAGAHRLQETACRGVQRGSGKSLAIVNETLLYKSVKDVCAYQGGFPVSVSEALGEEQYSEAVGGVLSRRYYISMKNAAGERELFVYDLKRGIWMREDRLPISDFAAVSDELYALAGNRIYAMGGSLGEKESHVCWTAESGLLYYRYPERKYLSRFSLRMQMEQGAEMAVYIEYDSCGLWESMGKIRMKGTGSVTLPIRPRRCDHMRIRLVGKGEFRLFSVAKHLSVGSDV